MSLISQLLQEISEEEKRAGESQCFVGHEFRQKDLRIKLERALKQLDLQAYFADREVTGEFILAKVCKKILVTRASIMDLTTANPNVYFELGVAIGLNKPVFVVLKRGASVPPLLENFVKLRFTHYAALERELTEQVPGWLKQSIEQHLLYDNHCHFVNILCPDRQRFTPQRHYLVVDQVEGTDETDQPILTHDPDLYAELPVALDCFHFTPMFLDEVPVQGDFRLCDYCRALRASKFALCHITRHTSLTVYLLLGLVTGLDIPSLLIVHEERDKKGQSLFEIPTMLRGLDAFYYEHSVDIGNRLGSEVEGFLNRPETRSLNREDRTFWRAQLASARELANLEEQATIIVRIIAHLAELNDTTGIYEALDVAQSIPDFRYRAQAVIAVTRAFARVRDRKGIDRVVKLCISGENPNFQAQVLSAASQAFRSIGHLQKASEVNSCLNRLLVRKGGQRDFFGSVVKKLESLKLDYMIVGSLACNLYGTSRAAADIDIVIHLEPQRIPQFRQAFSHPRFYVPDSEDIRQAILEKGIFNVIEVSTGLKADFHVLQDTPQAQREFQRRRRRRFISGLYAYYSTPEDLILNKLEYFKRGNSKKHMCDIQDIVNALGSQLDFGYIEWGAKELGVDMLWHELRQKWLK